MKGRAVIGATPASLFRRQQRLKAAHAALLAADYGVVAEPKLNDFNPYSFDADGWCEPTEARVQAYDRAGTPVDTRAKNDPNAPTASTSTAHDRRSVLAAHIEVLAGQSRRAVAYETLWDRWAKHPRLAMVQGLFPRLEDSERRALLLRLAGARRR